MTMTPYMHYGCPCCRSPQLSAGRGYEGLFWHRLLEWSDPRTCRNCGTKFVVTFRVGKNKRRYSHVDFRDIEVPDSVLRGINQSISK